MLLQQKRELYVDKIASTICEILIILNIIINKYNSLKEAQENCITYLQ